MTTEQREFKLDKRIAIFEQGLNLQQLEIEAMCPTINNNAFHPISCGIRVINVLVEINLIKSQKMVPFKKGGIDQNKLPEYVINDGKQTISKRDIDGNRLSKMDSYFYEYHQPKGVPNT